MNGIYGFIDPRGAPGPAALTHLESMHQFFARSLGDNRGVWQGERASMGATMGWNTPDSRFDQQPHCATNAPERYIIVADARLDNRAELIEELSLSGDHPSIPDSEIILQAYLRWKENASSRLLGDFVYAIWDRVAESLFCSRDPLGVRCLYYAGCPDDGGFYFSNHIAALTESGLVPARVDQAHVEDYLRWQGSYSPDRTFFQGIKRLSAATNLYWCNGALSLSKYWRPEDVVVDSVSSESELLEALRGLMVEAVSARSISDYPIFAHLSGGLDSSAIAVMCASLMETRGRELHVYSWNHQSSGQSGDCLESQLISDVVATGNMTEHQIELTVEQLAKVLSHHDIAYDDTVDLWYEFPSREYVKQFGGRTVLSGWGGDEFISGNGLGVFEELVLSGNLGKALHTRAAPGHLKLRTIVSFVRQCVRAFARALKERLGMSTSLRNGALGAPLPDFLLPPSDYLAGRRRQRRFATAANSWRQMQCLYYSDGHLQERLQSWYAAALEKGIEYRYPWLDRRLVEFALALPGRYFYEHGQRRWLYRRALEEVLPDVVRTAPKLTEAARVEQYFRSLAKALARALYIRPPADSLFIDREQLMSQIRAVHCWDDGVGEKTMETLRFLALGYLVSGLNRRRS